MRHLVYYGSSDAEGHPYLLEGGEIRGGFREADVLFVDNVLGFCESAEEDGEYGVVHYHHAVRARGNTIFHIFYVGFTPYDDLRFNLNSLLRRVLL
jgi:hypothetical protein